MHGCWWFLINGASGSWMVIATRMSCHILCWDVECEVLRNVVAFHHAGLWQWRSSLSHLNILWVNVSDSVHDDMIGGVRRSVCRLVTASRPGLCTGSPRHHGHGSVSAILSGQQHGHHHYHRPAAASRTFHLVTGKWGWQHAACCTIA